MTPDIEARALRRPRDLVRGNSWLRGVRRLALVFTVLSFYRILSHTTLANLPVPIIGSVVCAVITWTIYALWLNHARKRRAPFTRYSGAVIVSC